MGAAASVDGLNESVEHALELKFARLGSLRNARHLSSPESARIAGH